MPSQENNSNVSTAEASREQPWKKFIDVPQKTTNVTFSDENKNIRMIDGRVDGKGLGG